MNKTILTQREQQIAECLLRGWDRKSIGKHLGIAQNTLKHHLSRMFLKFDITCSLKYIGLALTLHARRSDLGITCPCDTPTDSL